MPLYIIFLSPYKIITFIQISEGSDKANAGKEEELRVMGSDGRQDEWAEDPDEQLIRTQRKRKSEGHRNQCKREKRGERCCSRSHTRSGEGGGFRR